MTKTIEAIYEDGVFKPTQKVRLREREKVELTISKKAEIDSAIKKAMSIIGVGESTLKDTARKHDEYLYGKKRRLLKKIK
ncbi:MAG: antitoxin family protein [Deferribacteres bacterium]|nr:antitoxin family protein [Deferribacteres bacterium]